MDAKLKKVLLRSKYETPAGSAEKIWSAIVARNKRLATLKLFAYSTLGFASLTGMVPAIKMLTHDFAQSGFYEYSSLLFSDGKLITSYWQEFVFSLAQSLPILSILLSLGLVFVFFLSIRYAWKQAPGAHLSLNFKI